jgi:hypothetical protein
MCTSVPACACHFFLGPTALSGREETNHMFKRVSIGLFVLALLAIIGCSSAPQTEMKNAETAMQAATAAEAEQYAPEAYRAAVDTLNAAQAAKTEQDSKFSLLRGYGKSKAMFVAAQALADTARVQAETEKARVKAEVEGQLVSTQQAMTTVSAALDKAPRGKGTKADIAMLKNDLATVKTVYDEANSDFTNGKYLAAQAKLQTVNTQLQSLSDQLQKATAMKTTK